MPEKSAVLAAAPRKFSAPARVNLLGEHTDYTGGLVLPMAIPFYTTASMTLRDDAHYSFESEKFKLHREMPLDDRSEAVGNWSDYSVGVLRQLQMREIHPPAFSLHLSGNVPFGAGLSSSASVEVATAVALLGITGTTLTTEEIAVLSRAAENDYVHSPCGIMDQFVITAARAGHALLLNTRTLHQEHIPMNHGGLAKTRIVVCNSMVKHSVASGEYGVRHAQAMAGQAAVKAAFPQIRDLGEATLEQLAACEDKMSLESYMRCRHIISENKRVNEARDVMSAGDTVALGKLMVEAHASYSKDFDASCEETDFLADTAITLRGCFGARLTGGGFGGCTVNLVAVDDCESFTTALKNAYRKQFDIDADAYICEAVDGAMIRNGMMPQEQA